MRRPPAHLLLRPSRGRMAYRRSCCSTGSVRIGRWRDRLFSRCRTVGQSSSTCRASAARRCRRVPTALARLAADLVTGPPLRSLNCLPQSRQQDCRYPPCREIGSLRDRSRRTRRAPSTPRRFLLPKGTLPGRRTPRNKGLARFLTEPGFCLASGQTGGVSSAPASRRGFR